MAVGASLDELLERSAARRRLPDPAVRRLLRTRASLTQAELSTVVGVDRAAISRWESGQRTPRGETLDAYLDVLEKLAGVRAREEATLPG
jgi:transcriptional regulator with XRE-family HTH domain